jgi:hypothetical protein
MRQTISEVSMIFFCAEEFDGEKERDLHWWNQQYPEGVVLTPTDLNHATRMVQYPLGYCMPWHPFLEDYKSAPPEIVPVLEAWARAIDLWEPE